MRTRADLKGITSAVVPHYASAQCQIMIQGTWVVSQVVYSSGGGALRTIQTVGCGERCFQDEYERHCCVAAQGKEEGCKGCLIGVKGFR
jgi:hypothetical protein